jgi:hypothetical protein
MFATFSSLLTVADWWPPGGAPRAHGEPAKARNGGPRRRVCGGGGAVVGGEGEPHHGGRRAQGPSAVVSRVGGNAELGCRGWKKG